MLKTTRPTKALTSLVVAVALLGGCSAEVTGPNRAPRAVAGPDQECEPGQAVVLDGAASWDPDGDPIFYRWRQLTAPGGAPTSLEVGPPVGLEPTQARLVPDRPGTWLIALTVTDGRLESERDVVRVLVRGRPCQTDLECSDGLFCNGQERCLEGICRTGQPVDCSQADGPCTQGVCDEDSDTCSGEPLPAGTACDDGLFCTQDDACDADGACTGPPRSCPAGGACEQAVCNEDVDACGLEPIPDGQACDDGLHCTVGEACQAGVCGGGTARDCSAAGGSCADGTCDEELDRCDGAPLPDGTACDDQDACTQGDACAGGTCLGVAVDCSGSTDACNLGVCDPASGVCQAQPVDDGTACDDGLACTEGDVCQAGACTPSGAVDCSHLDGPCTSGVCQEPAGTCVSQPFDDGTACDDGLYCTDPDACTGGVCAGPDRLCPDPMDPCQQPTCDEAADQCDLLVADDGTPCDDGSACTTDDQCTGGTCNGTGVACPLGCNEAAGRCYQLQPTNVGPDRLCVAGAADLSVDDGQTSSINTDTGTIGGHAVTTFQVVDQGAGLPELAVFSFGSIQIGATSQLDVVGSRALVLLACGDVLIDGVITADADGRQAGAGGYTGGRGASRDGQNRPVPAEAGIGPGDSGGGPGQAEYSAPYRESGGGGGGHGRLGGAGGDAVATGFSDHAGGAGGGLHGQANLEPLVGGAGGGGAASYTNGGAGGGGGGAIQISAGGTITIGPDGGLRAAGEGGEESQSGNYGAGGGGGAGGAILLEAAVIDIQGTLAANGGGGGGGRTDYYYGGQDCPQGTPTAGEAGPAEARRADGGLDCDADNFAPLSGPGGQGGALAGVDGEGAQGGSGRASGGGGGGAGRIRVNTHEDAGLTLSGVTSPDCGDVGGQQTSCSRGAISLW